MPRKAFAPNFTKVEVLTADGINAEGAAAAYDAIEHVNDVNLIWIDHLAASESRHHTK